MDRHRNNFDLIRLFAALLVILGHAFELNGAKPFLTDITHHQLSEGRLAVAIFFALSGYLITQSYMSRRDAPGFVKSRLLRILPGLAVAIVLTVFVLGPLVTSLPVADYFSSTQTWRYLKNIVPTSMRYQLPGVFQHNGHGVNGSLWTIPIELRCYLGVLVLGLLRVLDKRVAVLGALAACLLAGFADMAWKDAFFYTIFLSGAVFYLYRDRIPFNKYLATACLAGLVAAASASVLLQVAPLLVTYLVLYIAWLPLAPLRGVVRHDLSYGIYIYAFPVQQTLIHLFGGRMDPLQNFLLTLPPCVALAALSWFLVEKPCLRLKNKEWQFRWRGPFRRVRSDASP